MKQKSPLAQGSILAALLLACLMFVPSTALGQATEQEPNNTCQTAQNFGSVDMPFILDGVLGTTQQNPELDFFRFIATPGLAIQADLEGSDTGRGTLSDPFIGFFDSSCALIRADDDSGVGLNSRLIFTVPDDGVFILAVNRCCDSGFTQGGVGTYRLTFTKFDGVVSISGRITDSVTGAGLPGFGFPFARAELRRCVDGQCFEFVGSQSTDSSGRYRFDNNFGGTPIRAGSYKIFFSASLYVSGETEVFNVLAGESRDVGDFALTPMPTIGSISGTLVDAVTRQPLSGGSPTFAFVDLIQCNQFGCFQLLAFVSPDSQGRFRFERDFSGLPLLAGRYQIRTQARSYQAGATEPFDVAENQHLNIGEVLIPPFPVRISDVQPCENVPSSGGPCIFRATLHNGLSTPLNAKTWVLANSSFTGSFLNFTNFQASEPPVVSIPFAGSRTVEFRFDVPGSVRDGAFICPQIFVGQSQSSSGTNDKNAAFFNTLAQTSPFCIIKRSEGFRVLPESETRQVLRNLNSNRLIVDPGKK